MQKITTRDDFIQFADEQGVRDDWHEPDEQKLTATVRGVSFDNTGTWATDDTEGLAYEELHVLFWRTVWVPGAAEPTPHGAPLAAVNLATLCAWATGFEVPNDGELTTDEFKRTEAYWRSTLANEVRDYAEELEAEITTKSFGVALSALVKQAGDRIGQMSRANRPNRWEMLNEILRQAGNEYPQGLAGVRDVIAQRDGYLDAMRENDEEIANLKDEITRLKNRIDEADS